MPVIQDAALRSALQELARGASLSEEDAAAAFGVVMRGDATAAQIAGLLMGLRAKGETASEIAGAARALRAAMVRLDSETPDLLVDTCGTGGGRVGTLNLSTAAAFVVAGAGVAVAKHGNRSYTSRSGSADVLEALGVEIDISPSRAADLLHRSGIVFLYAPTYHPAMRHVAQVRRELGVSTIMNLLGPLVNPAGVVRQVVGVAEQNRGPLVASALERLGAAHAMVVHARIGMDEVSPDGLTDAWEVCSGVTAVEIDPATHDLRCSDLDGLAGGEPAENARRIEELLHGRGSAVERCAVVLNAGAALYVAGRGWSFDQALTRARDALEAGAGADALARLRAG